MAAAIWRGPREWPLSTPATKEKASLIDAAANDNVMSASRPIPSRPGSPSSDGEALQAGPATATGDKRDDEYYEQRRRQEKEREQRHKSDPQESQDEQAIQTDSDDNMHDDKHKRHKEKCAKVKKRERKEKE